LDVKKMPKTSYGLASGFLMNKREEEIAELIGYLSAKSKGFTRPKLIVIGGYALRAFVPFTRYSRDCDFVLKEGLNIIEKWAPPNVSVETLEKKEGHAYMRWIKILQSGSKKAKLGLDFMEGQVRGRENEVFTIDGKFLDDSKKVEIKIGSMQLQIFVPSYTDFFLLKVMSARRSDTRDIATLVWKNGVPKDIKKRLNTLNNPAIFTRNLEHKIIPDIKHKLFLNSWKGTFITSEFTEHDQKKVVKELESLL
jgi:hypothetical protein